MGGRVYPPPGQERLKSSPVSVIRLPRWVEAEAGVSLQLRSVQLGMVGPSRDVRLHACDRLRQGRRVEIVDLAREPGEA